MFSKPHDITGKWHGKSYKIESELGRGANGIVYLAKYQNQPYALKVGQDSFSITSEVNVLKHFGKAQGAILGPSVYDVDDWQVGVETRPFYVMNLIEGSSLRHFVKKRGKEWIPVFMIQLIGFLHELHQQDWVFGDLKPDHLQVIGQPPKLAWFDAGGMTKMGRAIKEYTEAYDRGHWQMGGRRAEPSYDLFSAAMILLHLYQGELPQPENDTKTQLRGLIFEDSTLLPYQTMIWQALQGKYTSALEMKKDLIQAWHVAKGGTMKDRERKPLRRSTRQQAKKKVKWFGKVISFLFLSTFFILLYALYLFSQTIS